MNNYENQKTAVDLIMQNNSNITVDKDTNEVADCNGLNCGKCLFADRDNSWTICCINRVKWLVSEYKEPEVDWSKVPVDTPVLVSNNKDFRYNRYFAGTDDEGKVLVFPDGRTSWSNKTFVRMCEKFDYIKLAEVE